MKDKGMIFQGWGVRAIQADLKTMTRRVIKPQPTKTNIIIDAELLGNPTLFQTWLINSDGGIDYDYNPELWKCPYPVGTRLWVRETWTVSSDYDDKKPSEIPPNLSIDYFATDIPFHLGRKRPSIFMPRWASRINLIVIEIRAERVRDITWDNAVAEGWPGPASDCDEHEGAVEWFKFIWDSINGKPRKDGVDISWAANPWVWVISFQRKTP